MDMDGPELAEGEAEDPTPPSPYRSVVLAALDAISTHESMRTRNVQALRALLRPTEPPTPEGIAAALSEPEPEAQPADDGPDDAAP